MAVSASTDSLNLIVPDAPFAKPIYVRNIVPASDRSARDVRTCIRVPVCVFSLTARENACANCESSTSFSVLTILKSKLPLTLICAISQTTAYCVDGLIAIDGFVAQFINAIPLPALLSAVTVIQPSASTVTPSANERLSLMSYKFFPHAAISTLSRPVIARMFSGDGSPVPACRALHPASTATLCTCPCALSMARKGMSW